LSHQAGNKGHIAREAIELGDKNRAFLLPRYGQRCGKLRPSVEGVGSPAGFYLSELAGDGDAFSVSEACDCRSLCFEAET